MIYSKEEDAQGLLTAYYGAEMSLDNSTQVGSFIRDMYYQNSCSIGINRISENSKIKSFKDFKTKEEKYKNIIHSEVDCIEKCCSDYIKTEGNTMYCTWFSCSNCAAEIVKAGITRVVGCKRLYQLTPERWKLEIETGHKILRDNNINIDLIEIDYSKTPKILFDGKIV